MCKAITILWPYKHLPLSLRDGLCLKYRIPKDDRASSAWVQESHAEQNTWTPFKGETVDVNIIELLKDDATEDSISFAQGAQQINLLDIAKGFNPNAEQEQH